MTAQLTTTSTLSWTDRPLAETADAVLLDLDGVVWRGAEAIEHAAEVLATLAAAGIPRSTSRTTPRALRASSPTSSPRSGSRPIRPTS